MKNLMNDKELYQNVKTEILDSFTLAEINKLETFQEFWEQVDVQNFYEANWNKWKKDGIKGLYQKIFDELKKIPPAGHHS